MIESDCSVSLHGSEKMSRFSLVETLHGESLMMEMDIIARSNLSNIFNTDLMMEMDMLPILAR